jgi:3-oxoacyl-[acyl-carrier protein] reductase
MDLGIKGEVALVLGGTQGLALACAQSLAEAGVRVILNGRDRAKGEAAARILGADAYFVAGDQSDPDERARIFDDAHTIARPITILVNNAAGPPPGQFGEHDRATWLKAIETNMLAAIDMTERCLPDMIARGFGRIVNITSFAVREPYPNLLLANSVRAGLHGAMATLAREVASKGVTVNNLLPGLMDTPALQRVYRAQSRRENISEEDAKRRMAASIPARRLGTAEDFGPACAFLCSRLASYITAQNLTIDGGFVRALL